MRALIRAGMDVARLNFSHGDEASHRDWIRRLRAVAAEEESPLCVLQDLSGPKIRIGTFATDKVLLKPGDPFTLTTRQVPGSEREVTVPFAGLTELARAAERLMLADGTIELRVTGLTATDVNTEVQVGGFLSDRKGLSFPGQPLPLEALTEKDLRDLKVGLSEEVDYVALSFVRSQQDILTLRRLIEQAGSKAGVIAKLERPEALDDLDAILDVVDGVMVARGDLAIELSPEKVPTAQKRIIAEASRRGRWVITATQMLESMIKNPWPTRAEASDVANAVLDGTDAVMLSGETATGDHPARVVEMMERILVEAEKSELYGLTATPGCEDRGSVPHAIACALAELVRRIDVKAICAFTTTGATARLISKSITSAPVLGLTPYPLVQRQINLGRGVLPVHSRQVSGLDDILAEVERVVREGRHAQDGDTLLVVAGFPFNTALKTNLIKVHRLGDEGSSSGLSES
jgi:pyruvate kinase